MLLDSFPRLPDVHGIGHGNIEAHSQGRTRQVCHDYLISRLLVVITLRKTIGRYSFTQTACVFLNITFAYNGNSRCVFSSTILDSKLIYA